jgi:hypothetical protein
VAPGQLLRHYAPDVPTRIVRLNLPPPSASPPSASPPSVGGQAAANGSQAASVGLGPAAVGGLIVVDFGGRLAWARSLRKCRYVDLSPNGSAEEAATALFASLRWAESIAQVSQGAEDTKKLIFLVS